MPEFNKLSLLGFELLRDLQSFPYAYSSSIEVIFIGILYKLDHASLTRVCYI